MAILTIDDYELLPSELAEGHELVDGELVGNTPNHIDLQRFLSEILGTVVRNRDLGRIYFELEYDFDGNAHGPDISFIGNHRIHLLDRNKRVQRFVPDLAIEIASISDTYEGLMQKRKRYLRCGTREVWVISIEAREVVVYSAERKAILDGPDVLATDLISGFSIAVEELFSQGLS
ncbi:MAG: Uma2 family endonuclease [Acidobacteriota bacterium]|nr:Uma2 family endonuclease [Acidobacteriota bacterium]